VIRRLRAFLRRDRLDDELAEEIGTHIQLRQRALIEQGWPEAEAAAEARRQFGNVTAVREQSRDHWGSALLTALGQDVRFGVRMIARTPALSAAVVLTIAFGAGLNGAVFLQLNDLFLRPPDLPNADTLVWLDDASTYPDYVDYRDRVPAIDLAIFGGGSRTAKPAPAEGFRGATGGSDAAPLSIVFASGNFFRVLQTPAALGRTFEPSEDRPPLGTAVAVLSHAYWTRQFNRSPEVLGRTIDLNGKPFAIVGVMPPGFSGARPPGSLAFTPDVWVPIWCHPLLEPGSTFLQGRTMWWGLQPIGRLREGATLAAARGQLAAVAAALDREYPGQRAMRAPWTWRSTDFDTRALRGQEAATLGVAGAATLLVMLIACGNVAGLLLARAAARRQEIAVRLSLGASRLRIVRQFLAEGVTLSALGTVLGFVLAAWLVGLASTDGRAPRLDGRIVAYALALTAVATLSAGLMPAIQASKTELLPDLARPHSARIGRLRPFVVGTEVAVSLVFLLSAALLLRGIVRAGSVDPGMPVEQLLAVSVDAGRHGYEGARLDAMLDDARRELEAIPGVRSTALVNPPPFSGQRFATNVRRADAPDSPGVSSFTAEVSSDYLDVAGVQVVRGRWFRDGDAGPDDVVINESIAARLWPAADPIGARMTTGDFNRRSHVVIGVVRDTPYAELRHQHEPFLFRPARASAGGTLLVRTSGPAAGVTRAATAAVQRLDGRLAVSAALPADRVAQDRAAGRRLMSAAAGIGALALLIALGGVAAIASHSVALRTREIGIRIALGARRADAVRLIVRLALVPVAIGAVAGLAIASLGSRVLVRQLYGVSPLDPVSFAGTAVFLMLAAATAAWLPARRAAGVDPVVALRSE
jgi:predicted permease